MTVKSELGSYSFEYPSKYKKELSQDFDTLVPFSTVILDGPKETIKTEVPDLESGNIKTVSGKLGTMVIKVGVSDLSGYWGKSFKATDWVNVTLNSTWDHFQLLGRKPIIVSGIEGEQIEYLIDRLMPIPMEDGENLNYCIEVFFDYNGKLWSVEAKGKQKLKDELIADFTQIVDTFKILD